VPGGRSMTRKSSGPQLTPRKNCCTTLWSIGPRQINGRSVGFKNPIDITRTPYCTRGSILSPAAIGSARVPIMRGTLGP